MCISLTYFRPKNNIKPFPSLIDMKNISWIDLRSQFQCRLKLTELYQSNKPPELGGLVQMKSRVMSTFNALIANAYVWVLLISV